VVVADLHDHVLAQVSDAEVLTVGIVAAKYLHNNRERALLLLRETHYLSRELGVSRFNRRLHALRDWLEAAPRDARRNRGARYGLHY